MQARIDALDVELQAQTTKHEGDVERAAAAAQLRSQALEEVAQLTQSLARVLEEQASSLQKHINSSTAVQALGSHAVAAVQSAVNSALELNSTQTSAFEEGSPSEGHEFAAYITLLSAAHDAAKKMLLMYDEIDLLGVSLEQDEQHRNISQAFQVHHCLLPSRDSMVCSVFMFGVKILQSLCRSCKVC